MGIPESRYRQSQRKLLPGHPPFLSLGIDGKIKTQFLMGNVYYRYPKWRVSPYVGLGLGAFFHDGAFTSTVTVGNELETIFLPDIELPIEFPIEALKTTVAYKDSRFGYQIMEDSRFGSPSVWSFTLAIAIAPVGGSRSMPTRLRQASDSGFDSTLRKRGPLPALLGGGIIKSTH